MNALPTTMQGRDRLSSDASSQHLSSNFRKIQNFIESPVFSLIINPKTPSDCLHIETIKKITLIIKIKNYCMLGIEPRRSSFKTSLSAKEVSNMNY